MSGAHKQRRGKATAETKWLRNVDLADYLGVSQICVYRWQRDPDVGFPQPTRINNLPYTNIDAIDSWMRSRVVDLADAGRKKAKVTP
jgi:predicted DNA-binding transcriptional regulator AlpA